MTSAGSPRVVSRWLGLMVVGVVASVAPTARADLDGQQACLDRESGSSCTRSSGEIGTCAAEPTIPGVLTCVPDGGQGGAAGASGNGAGGGNATAGSAGYVGTGTGAQGGSVDGPACSTPTGASDPAEGLFVTALCAGAMVLARRKRP